LPSRLPASLEPVIATSFHKSPVPAETRLKER
jgi:hypothetical protein